MNISTQIFPDISAIGFYIHVCTSIKNTDNSIHIQNHQTAGGKESNLKLMIVGIAVFASRCYGL